MSETLKAPLPYAGGKSAIAPLVWARLGDCGNYVEPFMGSAAVLLARPHNLEGKTETANDADGFLTCAYRAIQYAPEETAYWCDRPVNECDLTAFHLWLKAQRPDLTARLFADPFYYDAQIAGAYLWGAASWIGDGWCVADGPWINDGGVLRDRRTIGRDEAGVPQKMPEVCGIEGRKGHDRGIQKYRTEGVRKKMPEVGATNVKGGGFTTEKGIQSYRAGVPKKMPKVGANGAGSDSSRAGIYRIEYDTPDALLAYFARLQARLRRVRFLCGDWTRCVKDSVTVNHGLTGLFIDSPYPETEHSMAYHKATDEQGDVWFESARWAVAHGDDPRLRIAVCGYHSEATDALFPASWTRERWQARGGYANQADGRGRANAKREAIWFSPHCLAADDMSALPMWSAPC